MTQRIAHRNGAPAQGPTGPADPPLGSLAGRSSARHRLAHHAAGVRLAEHVSDLWVPAACLLGLVAWGLAGHAPRVR